MKKVGAGGGGGGLGKIIILKWICFPDSIFILIQICETAFVFCFLRKKWKSVYRLLQRHRCRPGTCSGRLQCADMELLSLRFSFCDAFVTGGIYIVFDSSCTASFVFFCFWTVFRGFSWTSLWTCLHRQLPCRS